MVANLRGKFINCVCFLSMVIVTAILSIQFAAPVYAAEEEITGDTSSEILSQPEDNEQDNDKEKTSVENIESIVTEEAEKIVPKWSMKKFLGTEIWRFVAAFASLFLGLVLRKISDYLFEKRFIPLLEKTPFQFDNLFAKAISKPVGIMILLSGLAGMFAFLSLPGEDPNIRGFAFGLIKVFVAANILWFLFRLIDVLVHYLTKLTTRTESTLDDQLIPVIRKSLKITIGIVVSIWIIQLLGYSVSSLIAGLGIGGLAVALAFQDTLGNFFGSVFIFTDRPFKVGEMVKIGDIEGTVEEIGFRTTKVRTWIATLVSIPNKTIAESVIENLSKRPMRRVLQNIGLTYETTADQMKEAVAAIRGILEKNENVGQDFMVIRFNDFGSSSLDIQVIYFIKELAYADFMEKKEQINLAIMRALEDIGLSIAFPTRTVYFEGDIARSMTGMADKHVESSGGGRKKK